MKPVRALLLLATLVPALMAAVVADASGLSQLPPSVTYRSDEDEYEYESSAARQQELWVVVGLRRRGQLVGPQRYQLWKLDAQGKKLAQVELSSITPEGGHQVKYSRIYGVAAIKNGNIGALAETSDGETGLLVFDGVSGELLTNRLVKTLAPVNYISKVFSSGDGDLLALGRSGTSGLLLKLRPSGEVVAQSRIEADGLTVLTDGLELPDHLFVLLGEHLSPAGRSNLWLGRVTLAGEVSNQTTFPGGNGSLTSDDARRTYTVVYSTAEAGGWSISLRKFTDKLSLAGQHGLLAGVKLNMQFRATPLSGGGIFVAGVSPGNRLWTAQVNVAGEVASSSTFEEPGVVWQRLWNYDLVATPAGLFIPFTELLAGKELEQRQVLKLLRPPQP